MDEVGAQKSHGDRISGGRISIGRRNPGGGGGGGNGSGNVEDARNARSALEGKDRLLNTLKQAEPRHYSVGACSQKQQAWRLL